MDKKDYILPLAVLFAALLIVIILIRNFGFGGIASFDFDMSSDQYVGMFTHLIIVTLIVERFIEGYNAIWRRPGRIEIETVLNSEVSEDKKAELQSKLDKYRARTGILAMYSGFAIGMVVALAGVRTLGVLFDASELAPAQLNVFSATDVIITAGLIAGGSKGLNAMTSLIEKYLQTSKDRIKPNPVPNPNITPDT